MKSMAEEWEKYSKENVLVVVNDPVGFKQAFYAGASTAFFGSMAMVNSPKSHDDCVEEIAAVAKELQNFENQKGKG